jgi:hypothetical protein
MPALPTWVHSWWFSLGVKPETVREVYRYAKRLSHQAGVRDGNPVATRGDAGPTSAVCPLLKGLCRGICAASVVERLDATPNGLLIGALMGIHDSGASGR